MKTPAQLRHEYAMEKGRNEAECIIAAEIVRVTGCPRSEALREAARLVRSNPQYAHLVYSKNEVSL